ncbi:hypothetical protein C8R44DRAFT_904230 [Mycena epipterygia]|nr:hypothetical protein C8R44DRAFT_904230 [Mycena epipterygia]
MLWFLFCIGLASAVRAQTLQRVSQLQVGPVTILESATVSISALGVGSDGMTTYVEVGAETLALKISGGGTQTLPYTGAPPFSTFLNTIDASKFVIGTTDSGVFESCTFRADGQGTCMDQLVEPGGDSTLTTTFSGLVESWYTLNAAASVVTTPSSPTASSKFSTTPSPTSARASQTAGLGSGSGATPTAPNNAGISSQRWFTPINYDVRLYAIAVALTG